MEWLAAALMLSLLGSLHCMGMCGGFAALSNSGARKWHLSSQFQLYLLGKTVAYVAAGILFGAIGTALHQSPTGARVLAMAVGIMLIWVGAEMAGINIIASRLRTQGPGWFIHMVGKTASSLKSGNRFVLGLLNGLLPCGLLYAAFAGAAATANPVHGGLFMLVFGLGTVPALFVAAQLGTLFTGHQRLRIARLTGWVLILFGIITILRGTTALSMVMH